MERRLWSVKSSAGIQELLNYYHCCIGEQVEDTYYRYSCKSENYPLFDSIHVFKNKDYAIEDVPKHWHYVSFGLTDVYGYERNAIVIRNLKLYPEDQPLPEFFPPFKKTNGISEISGFGFEITFRLKCSSEKDWKRDPPMWPIKVIEHLSQQLYKSLNILNDGDDIAWHKPLDEDNESHIKHFLLTLDSKLPETITTSGKLKFIQLVGVCQEELEAARELNVEQVLEIMREHADTGGVYLLTDMNRKKNIFQLNPNSRNRIASGVAKTGSGLRSIVAKHGFTARREKWFEKVANLTGSERSEFKLVLPSTLPPPSNEDYNGRAPSRTSYQNEYELKIENAEKVEKRFYTTLYLLLSQEAAQILPIVLKGRLAHRQDFSYRTFNGDLMTTLVPEDALDSRRYMVTREQPFAKQGCLLQIFISNSLREQMIADIEQDVKLYERSKETRNYSWPDHKLYITIVDDIIEE